MKTREDIIEHIKIQIEESSLGAVAAESVTADSRIIADLGLDSMDYATIMLATEQKFEIKIREDGVRWAEIQTVGQLADLFMLHS